MQDASINNSTCLFHHQITQISEWKLIKLYRTHFSKPWESTENKYFPPPLLPVLLHHHLSPSSADWKAIFTLPFSSSHRMNGVDFKHKNCEASKTKTFLDNYSQQGRGSLLPYNQVTAERCCWCPGAHPGRLGEWEIRRLHASTDLLSPLEWTQQNTGNIAESRN